MTNIKNPHIIHMIEDVNSLLYLPNDLGKRYLCIHAVIPTLSKSTTDPLLVTCKNCIKIMEKKHK